MHLLTKNQPCRRRFTIPAPLKSAALLVMAISPGAAHAGEVGAKARVYGYPDGETTIFTPIPGAPGGPLSEAQSGNGWKAYGVADFHALAVGGQSDTQFGSFGQAWVGGEAYWMQEITISSPAVPVGTGGLVDFTLFFQGILEASAGLPADTATPNTISYRWDVGVVPGAPDYSQSGSESRTVWGAHDYYDAVGPDFLNSPRNHTLIFGYGQPFTLKLALYAQAKPWTHRPYKSRVELRSSGWNGFRNYRIRNTEVPVTDAVVTSPSGFNFANPVTTTYPQWARLYRLPAVSPQVDSNNNGLSDLMEYALGRNPVEPDRGSPFTSGRMTIGGNDYACFSFTRPALGARPGDLTYLPQCSNDLSGWSSTGVETTVTPSATSQTETVTVRSTQPVGAQTREFLRLEVAPQP